MVYIIFHILLQDGKTRASRSAEFFQDAGAVDCVLHVAQSWGLHVRCPVNVSVCLYTVTAGGGYTALTIWEYLGQWAR